MPIPRSAASFDFIDEFHRLQDRVRRLEMRSEGAAGIVHTFIMDPITARVWPPALAAESTINGVLLRFESGVGIDVQFWVNQDGTDIPLHRMGIGHANLAVYSAIGTDMDFGDVMDLSPGDYFWPEVRSGSGSNISAGFILVPGQT